MRTVIEVGANYGNDTAHFLNNGDKVFAFEPTPELILHLQNRFKNNDNFVLVPMAVDDNNSWAKFNIAGSGDWGCSSLYEFTPDIHEKWKGRPDFHFTDSCIVMTIKLDTFCKIYNVHEIDYLWIDAQGNDFKVLKSLGPHIDYVKEGKCEGSYTVELYSNANNKVDDIVSWLKEKGFSTKVVPDNVGKEADIHFKRKK